MPSLVPAAFNCDAPGRALIWVCSSCGEVFDTGTWHPPNEVEATRVNEDFREHCAAQHPGDEPVVGVGGQIVGH